MNRLWRIRIAGVLVVLTSAFYVPWMLRRMNDDALWLAVPFVLANLLVLAGVILAAINNWNRSRPAPLIVGTGEEPHVAVIIPTYGEPQEMVVRTVTSVLYQDWPEDRLTILVSDDGHDPFLRRRIEKLAHQESARIVYHEPPAKGDPARRGDAKAGNLNSAMEALARLDPDGRITYVETRDADDEVGDARFLRRAVAQLEADEKVAYVQTTKRAAVSHGDPFGNLEPLFYEGVMFSRNAANAVVPCGSGLVWRRAALDDIGGFPTWNLVEDLQSGVEALRRGWKGVYVPVVGAVAQHAPEDLPNVYKQRSTWAMDTVRLMVWGRSAGLSLRQRLQFGELGMYYLQGLSFVVLAVYPIIGLSLGVYPLSATHLDYAVHFWPMAISIELFLLTLNNGRPLEELWRARQMWAGLSFVHAWAAVRAVAYGPRRKPAYVVTRKDVRPGLYLWQVVPHLAVCGGFLVAATIAIARDNPLQDLDLGSLYWGALMSLLLGTFARKAWFGYRKPVTQVAEPAPVLAGAGGPAVIDLRDGAEKPIAGAAAAESAGGER